MPGIQTPKDLLERLQVATGFSLAELAEKLGLRRQFVYNLADNKPNRPVGMASDDPRYAAIDALCKQHGIKWFIATVETALHLMRTQPVRFDRVELRSACHDFGNRIEDAGGMNDAEVSRLYIEICQRISVLTS